MGDFCNDKSAKTFLKENLQPMVTEPQNLEISSEGSTCFTCTALTHNNSVEDLGHCLGTVFIRLDSKIKKSLKTSQSQPLNG